MYYTQILMTAMHLQAGVVLRQDYFPEKLLSNRTQNSHLQQRISWGLGD
jgi:hypothetical protein